MSSNDYPLDFAFANGSPAVSAIFRQQPEDFQVDEDLGFAPAGEGEHVYLHVRKRNQNTQWLAGQLARFCGLRRMDVGYCGLKDRIAVTSQWFSLYLPKGPEPDFSKLAIAGVELLQASRHSRKLKPGMHQGNRFRIRLRSLSPRDQEAALMERCERVAAGVPNYFGEQRFGFSGGNLQQAQQLLVDRAPIRDRKQRGLIISAARAYLFNRVLSERVQQLRWRERMAGEPTDFPSGPLWGRGRNPAAEDCAALEAQVLAPCQPWLDGLEHVGLQQERRPLLCQPQDFAFRLEDADLLLSFSLPPGQYATAVLREIAYLQSDRLQSDNAPDDLAQD